jgi:hypothetical protein
VLPALYGRLSPDNRIYNAVLRISYPTEFNFLDNIGCFLVSAQGRLYRSLYYRIHSINSSIVANLGRNGLLLYLDEIDLL